MSVPSAHPASSRARIVAFGLPALGSPPRPLGILPRAAALSLAALILMALILTVPLLTPLGLGGVARAADDPEALYRDGEALRAQKNAGAAEMVFQRLVRVAPQHLRGRLALARVQLDHAPAEALLTLDAARVLDPNAEEVHWLRGRALEALGRLPEAAEAYRQVIRLNPRRTEVNARLRVILRTLRAKQTRVEEASQRFYANPNLATLSLFGRLLLDEAPLPQGLAELEDARQRVPNLPQINLWIARVQQRSGSLDGEIEAYQRYLSADPKAAGVRLLLAEHLQEAGRTRNAADTLAPFATDASLLNGLDNGERARLAFARSRIALAGNDVPAAARGLAEAVRFGLDPALLRDTFQSDLTLQPDEPELWTGYAQWLERSGEPGPAAEAWLQAGLLDPKRRPAVRQALAVLQAGQASGAKGGAPGVASGGAPAAGADAARLALARLALADGQPDEALRLAAVLPTAPAAQRQRRLLQGLAYRAQGNLTQSVDALLAYVLIEPDATGLARSRGLLLWELGDRAGAVAAWQEHPEALAGRPELLARSALFAQAKADGAGEQVFREQLALLPGVNPANRVRLGELYLSRGRTKEALAQWDAALTQNPRDFDLLLRVARQRFVERDMEQGTARLLQANHLRPVPIDLALILADWWRTQGRLGESLSLYWQVYKVRPREPKLRGPLPELAANVATEPEVRRVAAAMAIETQRLGLAADLLRVLLLEQPQDTDARVLLAEVYGRLGRVAEAGAVLKAAQPPLGAAEHLRLLAKIQRQAGPGEALAETLGRLAALEPNNPLLARERGLLLLQLGRAEEADPVLAPLAQRTQGDPELALALAQVDLARHRPQAAEGRLKEVLAVQPDQAEAHRLLQRLYQQEKRWEELGQEVEYQIGKNPRDLELREAAINAFLRAFKPPLARPHYDALRGTDPQRARQYAPYFP